MDEEFHYYATGLIALYAGFPEDEMEIIATASQFVDENNVPLKIQDRKSPDRIYENSVSQTMDILKPKHDLMRIYPLFHFLPGDPKADTAWRRDGKMHRLNTTPGSDNASEILDEALKVSGESRPYRIGIASHTFADTWAHQNFVGWYDSFNSLDIDIKPAIGHAEAEHHPDWVAHKWQDSRLIEPEIDNTNRFLSAARALFEKYCSARRAEGKEDYSGQWEKLKEELSYIFGRNEKYTGGEIRHRDERLKRFREKINLEEFNAREWFDAAIDADVHGLEDSHQGLKSRFTLFEDEYFWKEGLRKEETHWYRFQEAVKEHEKVGKRLLQPVFKRLGVDMERT